MPSARVVSGESEAEALSDAQKAGLPLESAFASFGRFLEMVRGPTP